MPFWANVLQASFSIRIPLLFAAAFCFLPVASTTDFGREAFKDNGQVVHKLVERAAPKCPKSSSFSPFQFLAFAAITINTVVNIINNVNINNNNDNNNNNNNLNDLNVMNMNMNGRKKRSSDFCATFGDLSPECIYQFVKEEESGVFGAQKWLQSRVRSGSPALKRMLVEELVKAFGLFVS